MSKEYYFVGYLFGIMIKSSNKLWVTGFAYQVFVWIYITEGKHKSFLSKAEEGEGLYKAVVGHYMHSLKWDTISSESQEGNEITLIRQSK